MNMKLILASCSPRRRELIKLLDLPFECISVDADESIDTNNPEEAVKEISLRKAQAAYEKITCGGKNSLGENEILIGADTVVALDGQILGKPLSDEDAEKTLRMLSGRSHNVFTGITLIYSKKDEKGRTKTVHTSFVEKTEVSFAQISDSDIKKYIALGDHKDKAGSYAIQGAFSIHVTGICGDYNNVVGFPVSRLYHEIQNIIF